MNITEYYKTIRAFIQKRMPDVVLQMETKPGDRICIRISREGEEVSPALCLVGYYDSYINGRALEETIQDILHDWNDFLKHIPDISGEDIYNWEKAKHRIFLTLMAENNLQPEGRLSRSWLDMKITVRYCISSENNTIHSFPVPVKLAREFWHVPEEEIFNTAGKNTETYFTPSMKSLFQILSSVIAAMEEKTNWKAVEMIHGSEPLLDTMYVLSNCYNLYGATAICYKGLLAGLYRRFGRPFYVIPCSINETILFPEPENDDTKMQINPKKMREIIFEVNRSTIEPKERLSDSLYYFDGRELTIAGTGVNDDE